MNDSLVTEAVLACVRFGNRPLVDANSVAAMVAIRNSLATIFAVIARGIASHPRYSKWTADEGNPGYLTASFRNVELRAPWNLVTDFPDDSTLEEFLAHAAIVKFQADSVICLSGSLLMRSAVDAISDLDLCEYVSGAKADFSQVARQAITTTGSEVICYQVGARVAEGIDPTPESLSLRRPWTTTASETFLGRVTTATTGKCDFAVISRSEGAVELTKVVLHVDARYTDTEGEWDLSFPYQEIGLDAGSWVPRRLASPKSIGRYVVWLFREVEAYAASAPAKAAKRALSLARILNAADLAEAAQRILRERDLALQAVLAARLKFRDRLVGIEDPALEPFRVQLDQTVATLTARLGTPSSLPAGETVEVDGLVAGFRSLLEPAVRMGRY